MNAYKGHRFPPDIISYAVWLYYRFNLSHRDIEDGQFELNTPRDRAGSFEPQLVKKHQRRFTSMDDKILFLYAQGMSTREIVNTFKDL